MVVLKSTRPNLVWLAGGIFATLACASPARANTWMWMDSTPSALSTQVAPTPILELHFAPEENLEAIDVGLIDNAGKTIDLAAYVLGDENVIAALHEAALRGVVVRILRDPTELGHPRREDLEELTLTSGVSVRVAPPGELMHLKAYAIDGEVYRSGSANFSWRGEHTQDNDLAVIRSAEAAAQFEAHFEKSWGRAK